MYTRSAALACGCLDRTGTLEVGERADLVLVDGALDDLGAACVRATLVGGEIRYGAVGAAVAV